MKKRTIIMLVILVLWSTIGGFNMIENAEHKREMEGKNKKEMNKEEKNKEEEKEQNIDKPIIVQEQKSPSTVYNAKISYDPVLHYASGSMEILAKNDTGQQQQEVYFHLYPNIFSDEKTENDPSWNYILGKERKPGNIFIKNVKVNGDYVTSEIKGTIMKIPLLKWEENEEVKIEINFSISVPKNNAVFSYNDHATWFGSWLPIRAVHTNEGWYLNPYHPIGDPLYSDVANYNVSVELPKGYHLVTTGNEEEAVVTEKRNSFIYQVSANNAREFAMTVLDGTFEKISSKSDGVTVNTWYRNQTSEVMKKYHETAVKTLQYFGERYGKYPYGEYDVVATGGFFGGMEYPGLVFVQTDQLESDNDYAYLVIAHETAHQWWYVLVGNNAIEEPWLDESLTSYSTLRFLLDEHKKLGSERLKKQTYNLHYGMNKFKNKGQLIKLAAKDFDSWTSYGVVIYYYGTQMFYQLEQLVGEDKMNEALALYVEKYKYKNATGEDLISVFEEVIGPEARTYFNSWLENTPVETLE